MVTRLSSWKHYAKIDHWEKDESGDTFMVDINGHRWLSSTWRHTNDYEYDPRPIKNKRPIIRTMKQNKKIMFYRTFNQEDISQKWKTVGTTLTYERAIYDFLYVKDANIASDSCDTLVELLLE